jgi:hypothetical protein
MAAALIFAGSVPGEKIWPSVVDEQIAEAKESAEFKSDPCDYNIDYGTLYQTAENEPVDEGSVTFECDPCDYNLDFGSSYQTAER